MFSPTHYKTRLRVLQVLDLLEPGAPVEEDAPASFKDVEGTQLAFAVETADGEAADIERHNPHRVVQ